jgi:3-oxoacyl-[acyl-carrier-protein] synthase-3
MSTKHATIVSTGRYLPDRELTNEELRRRLGEGSEQAALIDGFQEKTGIRSRWYAPEDWSTSDLALPAARQALARAGRDPEEVDLIILGTDTPDYVTPATSTVLQHKLGARRAGTFDVGCACASFPTALAIGSGLISTNPHLRTVLVVGAYMMHKLAAPDDPVIFFYGDGAGAAVLEPSERPGVISSAFFADGSYHAHWGILSGGTAEPATEASVRAGRTQVRLLEPYPPQINLEGWPRLVRDLARTGGFSVPQIDLAIFTQVRKPTIEEVMEELGLPLDRTHTVMEAWGYTGSSCVAIALDDAIEQGKVHPGDLVVLVGSGVGYNQAGVAFRMSEMRQMQR